MAIKRTGTLALMVGGGWGRSIILFRSAVLLLLLLSLLLRIIYSISCCGASVARPFATRFSPFYWHSAGGKRYSTFSIATIHHSPSAWLLIPAYVFFSMLVRFRFACLPRSPISRKCRFAFVFFFSFCAIAVCLQ